MFKKHYVEIAKVLKDNCPKYTVDYTPTSKESTNFHCIVNDLAGIFKRENSKFDVEKFIDAVYTT